MGFVTSFPKVVLPKGARMSTLRPRAGMPTECTGKHSPYRSQRWSQHAMHTWCSLSLDATHLLGLGV